MSKFYTPERKLISSPVSGQSPAPLRSFPRGTGIAPASPMNRVLLFLFPWVALGISFASPAARAFVPLETAQDAAETVVRESEAFFAATQALLSDGDPILLCPRCPDPLSISENFLRELNGRRFFVLLPAERSPFDIQFQVHFRNREQRFETLRIHSNRRDDQLLWLSTTYSNIRGAYDYRLVLELGEGFQSHGGGTVESNRVMNWVQNNEYRLVAFTMSHDPSDPRFSLILQDELMVNVITTPSPGSLLPTIKPALSLRPANLGISMTAGRKSRIKVSVGGGFALAVLPFADPHSATQGFFRLQFRP